MYNKSTGKIFARSKDINSEWFGYNSSIKPIWTVNQKEGNGRRSAVSWVGGEVIFDDVYHTALSYNPKRPFRELADFFLQKLNTTDEDERVNFVAMYYDQPGFFFFSLLILFFLLP